MDPPHSHPPSSQEQPPSSQEQPPSSSTSQEQPPPSSSTIISDQEQHEQQLQQPDIEQQSQSTTTHNPPSTLPSSLTPPPSTTTHDDQEQEQEQQLQQPPSSTSAKETHSESDLSSSSTNNPITTIISDQEQQLQGTQETHHSSSPQASSSILPSSLTPPPSTTTVNPQQSHGDSLSSSSTSEIEQVQDQQHPNLQNQIQPDVENQQVQQQPPNWKKKVKPYAIVIFLQVLFAIMNFFTKLAMNNGMSSYVLVAYRNITACLFFSPFAAYHERHRWPEITLTVFWKILVLSVLALMDQDLYFLGMKFSTATIASALSNTLPGITFTLACITRRETINITSKPSQAKILGTIITVIGAMVMTFVKGPVLFGTVGANSKSNHHDGFYTVLGSVFILLSTLSSAVSNILQNITLSQLDLPLTVTSLICLFTSIEAVVVAVVLNKKIDYSVWTIFEWDIKLLSAIYAGIFCSGIGFYLRGQVMQARGPVFATMFNPVCMILVALSGYFFLDEQQLLGRVIGALIICLGLYCVVWGTNKDNNLRQQQENENAVANP